MHHTGVPFAHNAANLVQEYRTKLGRMYDMWVDLREGVVITLQELKVVCGLTAYPYNDDVAI